APRPARRNPRSRRGRPGSRRMLASRPSPPAGRRKRAEAGTRNRGDGTCAPSRAHRGERQAAPAALLSNGNARVTIIADDPKPTRRSRPPRLPRGTAVQDSRARIARHGPLAGASIPPDAEDPLAPRRLLAFPA